MEKSTAEKKGGALFSYVLVVDVLHDHENTIMKIRYATTPIMITRERISTAHAFAYCDDASSCAWISSSRDPNLVPMRQAMTRIPVRSLAGTHDPMSPHFSQAT